MKASQLIKDIASLIGQHGDCEILIDLQEASNPINIKRIVADKFCEHSEEETHEMALYIEVK